MSRPTKLTREVQARFMEAIRAGAAYEHAAGYAGISEKTFYNWRDRGEAELARVAADPRRSVRQEEAPFVEFLQELEKAVGEAAVSWLKTLDSAAGDKHKGQWQAHAWKLERRHPGAYGRRDRHEHTGEGGGSIKVIVERKDMYLADDD